jgi:hypothetical protein
MVAGLNSKGCVTFQMRLPNSTECVLPNHVKPVHTCHKRGLCIHITPEPRDFGIGGWEGDTAIRYVSDELEYNIGTIRFFPFEKYLVGLIKRIFQFVLLIRHRCGNE